MKAPGVALAAARRLILGAMQDPDGAAGLLDRATGLIDAALAGVGPETPEEIAEGVTRAAQELFAIMGCFTEETS